MMTIITISFVVLFIGNILINVFNLNISDSRIEAWIEEDKKDRQEQALIKSIALEAIRGN